MATREIKSVFEQISKEEKHEFVVNEFYVPKRKFQIETDDGFKDVLAMIVKKDDLVELTLSKGSIKLGAKHRIKTISGDFTFVEDLVEGDTLANIFGEDTITKITKLKNDLVYDISVDYQDRTYIDKYGFVHHNTYHITEGEKSLEKILGPEGDKWTYHSGTKAAPFAFYKTLFQEREKIIVFDEADSLLKNKDIVMMLKPILDTSGANMAEYMSGTENMVGKSAQEIREYSQWVDSEIADGKSIGTGKRDVKLPSKFAFEGGMIFISNMKASEIEGAIMSRSLFVDVHLAASDIIKRIKTIGYAQADNDPDVTREDIDEVAAALGMGNATPDHKITYMTPEIARDTKQVTVRALKVALLMKKSGLKDWKRLAGLYS